MPIAYRNGWRIGQSVSHGLDPCWRRLTFLVGFPLTMHHYYDRINALLYAIDNASLDVLSSNRSLIDRFMGSGPLRIIHAILAGVRSLQQDTPWDSELFSRFKDYVEHEEAATKQMLQRLRYYLDAPNTVALVLGSGRPEKVSEPSRCALPELHSFCSDFYRCAIFFSRSVF